jgi:hypothetical protein
MRKCTLDERPSMFIRDKPIFSSERVLHKDYYCRGSFGKKDLCTCVSGGLMPGQTDGKPPVVK